jgi:hypothetical protein
MNLVYYWKMWVGEIFLRGLKPLITTSTEMAKSYTGLITEWKRETNK